MRDHVAIADGCNYLHAHLKEAREEKRLNEHISDVWKVKHYHIVICTFRIMIEL